MLNKKTIILILLFIFFIPIIYFYFNNFKLSFNYHPDIARDLNDILDIAKGDFTLIGPKLSFSGLYAGPYYYYLFLPAFVISHFNPHSLLIFNLILYLISFIYFYLAIAKKYNVARALFAMYFIAFSSLFFVQSRNPWNGSSYLPLLLIFLSSVYLYKKLNFCLGFLAGVMVQFHPALLLAIVPLIILFTIHNKSCSRVQVKNFLLGIVVSLLPIMIFELKNNFIISRSLWDTELYLKHQKLLINFEKIREYLTNYIKNISISGIIHIFSISLAVFICFKKSNRWLSLSLILSFILTLAINYFQFGPHYFFPFYALSLFFITIVFIKSKYYFLIFPLIVFNLMVIIKSKPPDNTRHIEKYEKVADIIINQGLIFKEESFNILYLSKDYGYQIVNANEYKFLFKKAGYIISDFDKNEISTKMLIISDDKDFDLKSFSPWEVEQFKGNRTNNYRINTFEIEDSQVSILIY